MGSMTAQLTEAAFQHQIIDYAALNGWSVYHASNTKGRLRGVQPEGFPDLFLVKEFEPGKTACIAAELKTGERVTTNDQMRWLQVLDGIPGVLAVVWRPESWPKKERWPRVETSGTGNDEGLGAIGARLRLEC